jgi:tripartite-type tricarboxylate transporter receptor subunit TctC
MTNLPWGAWRRTVATAVAALTATQAWAAWPDKPLTLIVPFAAAGISDNQSRSLAQKLSVALGQPVIVENKPGAGGMVGTEYVAHAAPDGYTLLYGTHGTQAANLALYRRVPYDPVHDLVAVHSLFKQSTVLVANSTRPYNSLHELIDYARAHPGAVNYASAGAGTQTHLASELLQSTANVKFSHIPYKGAGPAMSDLLAGNVDILFDYPETSMPHIATGKIKPLAVTGNARLSVLPNVPTVGELGLPGAELVGWSGIFVPAKTPPAIVDRLAAEIAKATNASDTVAAMARIGSVPMDLSRDKFQAFAEAEVAHWRQIVQLSGAKLD